MIYRGTIRDGVVVFTPEVKLPEGTDVTVQPVLPPTPRRAPADAQATVRNGVPVFQTGTNDSAPDLDLVNRLRDETP
ncbi:MAG: hypothetical protein IID44_10405 [Planctomycetes bacterium]|nr:hypothetical protein [Planctomycetota bacterium]